MKSLKDLLTPARLRSLASPVTLQRGQDYFLHGHVQPLMRISGGIQAFIAGQRMYVVELYAEDGSLEFSCTCPMGDRGEFCKHCVAAAIAYLKAPPPENAGSLNSLRPLLEAETPARLAAMILEWAVDDDILQERLFQYKARLAGPDAAISAARLAFHKAALPEEYVEYDQAHAVVDAVWRAIENFESLLQQGHAAAVMDLCEFALRTLTKTYDRVDLDDELTVPAERIEELHLQAALQAAPNPAQLAERLFQLEINPNIYAFDAAAETYKDLLGPAGLAAYKDLAESADFTRPSDRYRILESVARASGNVDDMIALLARDLSSPERFTAIIELCLQAGAHPQALTWAKRGNKLYPGNKELREALAGEYHHAGQHEDAVKLIWKSYTESPGLPLYKTLQRHAQLANDWPEYRDRAIGLIRSRIAAAKGKQDHSALVEILLAEPNVDDAWREAHEGGCASYLWLQLAEACQELHPGDAAPIFLKRTDEELARGARTNYEVPISHLLRAAALMRRIDAMPSFRRHIAALREQHKAKRTFIQLLDKHRAALESAD